MKISAKQLDSVVGLPGPKRYAHLIKVAADQRKVWGLYNEGWALAGASKDEPVFPIWPAREYAVLCALGEWAGYVPREIELDDLLEGLLPSLKDRNTSLGVFYTPDNKGVIPDLAQFEQDLRTELARIE